MKRHVGERTDAAGICDHHCRWKPGGVRILGRFLFVCVHWRDRVKTKSRCRSHGCMHIPYHPTPQTLCLWVDKSSGGDGAEGADVWEGSVM